MPLPKKGISKRLIKDVRHAVEHAYAPYSHVTVAAGIYCRGGRIFTGVNIENSSYSLTVCAERVALYKAISEGVKDFVLVLLYSPQVDFITPCGACLQVLHEFAPDLIVVTMNRHEEFRFYPLRTLLTRPFELKGERKSSHAG
jgi:cytidine deaminase